MGRACYLILLRMHPAAFRRFTEEMVWIYDETVPSSGALVLVMDALASLGRQWVLRSAWWKLAAAVAGACLQVTAGGLLWEFVLGRARWRVSALNPDLDLQRLMLFIVASACVIVLMVVIASIWTRSFLTRRARGLRAAK
jgi:hypothetical protein